MAITEIPGIEQQERERLSLYAVPKAELAPLTTGMNILAEIAALALQEAPETPSLVQPSSPQRKKQRRATTNGMRDTMGQYLYEINLTSLIDADKERELAQRIEAGREAQNRIDDQTTRTKKADRLAVRDAAEARDHFIRANLRLVVSISGKYKIPKGLDRRDLIQEGNLGLEHAVAKFDWRKGFKFSTYATIWIRRYISRVVDEKGGDVRLPNRVATAFGSAMRAAKNDPEQLEDPEMRRIARVTNQGSLDYRIGDDGDSEVYDLVPDMAASPEAQVMHDIGQGLVDELLETLEPAARITVTLRLGLLDGDKRTFKEIGESLGIKPEAARRLFNQTMVSLRDNELALSLRG